MAERARRSVAGVSLAGLLVAALMAGCAGVPTSGPVHVGRAVPAAGGSSQDGIRVLPAPPQPGMSQVALVDGFLRATVDADDDYSAARAYLAPGTAWDTSVGTRLYNQGGLKLTRAGSNRVRMQAPSVGRVSNRGDFVTAMGPVVRRFTTVRLNGQWRISRTPPGVLLASIDAQRSLVLDNVYYLNQAGNALVPEPILVPPEQPGSATTLMRALLAGPPAPLSSAVTTGVPRGTRLLGNVPVGSNGIAEVDLSVLLTPISPATLRRLSAQIVWTLHQVPNVRAVQLLVDGDALIAPGFPQLQTTKVWAGFDPHTAPTPSGLLYVRHGRVAGIGTQVPKALSTESGLLAPAIGAGGRTVAALRRHGMQMQLLTGPAGGSLQVRLTAPFITPPSVDRSGDVLVADSSSAGSQIVQFGSSGGPVVINAAAGLLARGISDLAVSPDGAQVAMDVGSPGSRSLMIGLLDRHRSVPALTGARTVLPPSDDAAGVAWEGSDAVVATAAESPGSRAVVSTDTVGYDPHPLAAVPLPGKPTAVAAAAEHDEYTVVGGTLYRFDGSAWHRLSTGTDPSYAG